LRSTLLRQKLEKDILKKHEVSHNNNNNNNNSKNNGDVDKIEYNEPPFKKQRINNNETGEPSNVFESDKTSSRRKVIEQKIVINQDKSTNDTNENNDDIVENRRLLTQYRNTNDISKTRAIHIVGFRRPLQLTKVKNELAKYGNMENFWMDTIKTHCYVIYSKPEEADYCFLSLNNTRFPCDIPKIHAGLLTITFASEQDALLVCQQGEEALQPKDKTEQLRQKLLLQTRQQHQNQHPHLSQPLKPRTPKDIFRYTETKPLIFWMPANQDKIKENETRWPQEMKDCFKRLTSPNFQKLSKTRHDEERKMKSQQSHKRKHEHTKSKNKNHKHNHAESRSPSRSKSRTRSRSRSRNRNKNTSRNRNHSRHNSRDYRHHDDHHKYKRNESPLVEK